MNKERIYAIIADVLEKDMAVLNDDCRLVEDLKADSIDLFDLVMAFEDEFSIEVEDDALENIKTVGDIVEMIEKTVTA